MTLDSNVTIDKVLGYNKFYLFFRIPISGLLRDQLNELYSLLSKVNLDTLEDEIVWRWKIDEIFSTHSL
jgi:hypothetical protein